MILRGVYYWTVESRDLWGEAEGDSDLNLKLELGIVIVIVSEFGKRWVPSDFFLGPMIQHRK